MLACSARAVPLVYSGYAVSFSKAGFADPYLPENQDSIVHRVAITRGSSRGIFNVARESTYEDSVSPLGTAWAFPHNNPSATLSAANHDALVFAPWQTANGGGGGGPPATVDQNAVVHLIEQDIYLDIRFTGWGISTIAGGSFSYQRAVIAPSADFDRNGFIDGQDFLVWQSNFGSSDALQTEGDANFDGVVAADDLSIWQTAYGNLLPISRAVPEPGGLSLAAAVAVALLSKMHRIASRRPVGLSASLGRRGE